MFSIDQNCHSLWDCLPKLQALSAKQIATTHFIEDIDVAFTSMGAALAGEGLRLTRERFHRSGGADWGAALFYSEFLGRLPVEIRQWEPYTGEKTNALAKQLGRGVDDLYDEFSPSDNWQLVGPSYVGDRQHHRTIGDLTVAQTAEFVLDLLAKARQNTLDTFPQADARQRTSQWFDQERSRLEGLLGDPQARLVDVYRDWLGQYLPPANSAVTLGLTSDLLAMQAGRSALLELFIRDYANWAGLYNQALEESAVGLRPLRIGDGELPFFASYEYQGHQVRSQIYLDEHGIKIADQHFALGKDGALPMAQLQSAGIKALAGKAVILVLQARFGSAGQGLALPYRGSMYMPAAYRFQQLLIARGMIGREVQPIFRVRFNFLDRLAGCQTVIHLPAHLHRYFGRAEIQACELAEHHAAIADQAKARLKKFKKPAGRQQWQQQACADLSSRIAELDRRRRQLAQASPDAPETRSIWQEVKLLKVQMLDAFLRQIADDYQARDLDYWDSRGALLPWSIALDGWAFYNALIAQASVQPEVPACGDNQDASAAP
jgi:hypothetical protein